MNETGISRCIRLLPRHFLAAILCWLFTSFGLSARAADGPWNVGVWQPVDTSPNSMIGGVAQSSDGYLWIGGSAGLTRFDGVKFEQYSLAPLVNGESSRVGALTRAHDGSILVAVWPGPVVQLQQGRAVRIVQSLPDSHPRRVAEDAQGAIWIGYYSGQVWRIDRDNQLTEFSTSDGLPGKGECVVVTDKNGRIWFSQANSVGIFSDGRFKSLKAFTNFPEPAAAGDGGMWVVSNFRLYHCDENGEVVDRGSFKPARAIGRALCAYEDRSGILWIGTSDNGLYRFDGTNFENIPISFHRVSSLLEDSEGNLWVGTQGGGLNRVRPRVVSLMGSATGLPSDMVMSICENIDGTIWVATQDGTLKSLHSGQWSAIDAKDSLYRDTVACVAADEAGALWVGTRNGRLVSRPQGGRETSFTTANGLAGKSISKLLATKGGDIWIAEQMPDTLQRLRNGEFKKFPLRFQSDHIRALGEDSAGNVWVASEQGKLWRVSDDQVTDESDKLPQDGHGILCLHADADGVVWVGTARWGVIRIENGKAVAIGADKGMFDNCIAQIVPDGRGWTWFGSSKGIFKVRQQELDDVAGGRSERVRSMHYGEDEGLPILHATVARSNGLRARDGKLWMIMASALATISPDKVHEQVEPPPVIIEKVTLDGREIAAYGGLKENQAPVDLAGSGRKVQLESDFHRLRFDFTALSFNAPSNVQFQYHLDGFDDHWMDAGSQRYASYSRLTPGNYRFEVKACNSDGIWNEAGTTLSLAVVPTLWQTWWFRAALVLAAAAVVMLFARYLWFRRLRQKLAALEQRAALDRERARIARDIHDDLGCGLTKIVLLSELSMQEMNGSPQTANVRQIATTAKQQMKSLDETVWAINPRNDTLADLIDYIGSFAVQSLRDAGVKCQVDLPDEPPDVPVPSEVRHSLFLAVKEAINNILRHSQASEVAVLVGIDSGALSIVIADNGQGFSPAPAQLGQDGLRNMAQRLSEIGGTFQVDSTPGAGTRISLLYPLPTAVTAA